MQLIFDSQTDIDISKNMACIDKESITEKFSADTIIEKLINNDTTKINKEKIDKTDNDVSINKKEAVLESSPHIETNRINTIVPIKEETHNTENGSDEPKDLVLEPSMNEELKNNTGQSNDNEQLETNDEQRRSNNLGTKIFQEDQSRNQYENNEKKNTVLDDTSSEKHVQIVSYNLSTDVIPEGIKENKNLLSTMLVTDEESHIKLEINDSENSENSFEDNKEPVSVAPLTETNNTCQIQENHLENISTVIDSEINKTDKGLNYEENTDVSFKNSINNLPESQEKMVKDSDSTVSEDTANGNTHSVMNIELEQSTEQYSLETHVDKSKQNGANCSNKITSNKKDVDLADESENIIVDKFEICKTNDYDSLKDKEDNFPNVICLQDIDLKNSKHMDVDTCKDVNTEVDSLKNDNKKTHYHDLEKLKDIKTPTDNDSNTIEINDDSSQDNDACPKIEESELESSTVATSSNDMKHDLNSLNIKINSEYKTSISVTGDNDCKSVAITNNVEMRCMSYDSNKILEKNVENEEDPKKTSLVSKLSNTLDFLSDDEEITERKINTSKNEIQESNKQCINIEDDDDDIMLIDDEGSSKVVDHTHSVDATKEDTKIMEENEVVSEKKVEMPVDNTPIVEKDDTESAENNGEIDVTAKENVDIKRKTPSPKPILPSNFVSTCKKNFAEMTRTDLEEFCLLKIVESVVDRGNLGEIKTQLLKMALYLEEHKNKAKMLAKQNQDLQIVLRSVQEELRNNSPITPLKITRSVGIQVFMSDTPKPISPAPQKNNTLPVTVNKPQKSTSIPKNRLQKPSKTPQQIPVPRLVPAKNSPNTAQNPLINNKAPSKNVAPATVRPTVKKPEKRPFSKTQADTVDLTDDEPPQKINTKPTKNQTVRVISPQNLMAPQRSQMGNSPRKVYIPISGAQVPNVRTGQAYMVKTINTHNVRPRVPPLRRLHPAPLPESGIPYQPPNWKAIPPPPEVKLSCVENGIVISWRLDSFQEDIHETIASYQIYAYQETLSPPSTSLWKKIGDVKALPLPMACTLTQFLSGYKYYFAVRAIDVRSRPGIFSTPDHIMLQD